MESRKDEGGLSKSGEVDQPCKVVTSKRRRCLSEEPEITKGGEKSIDAILWLYMSVSVSIRVWSYSYSRKTHPLL